MTRIAIACVLSICAQSALTGQGSSVGVAALLNDLAAYRTSVPLDELRVVLSSSLQDPSADIRTRALAPVAARSGAPRFSARPDIAPQWRLEQPVLRSLETQVLIALDDPDAKVRHGAVLAIGNLQYSAQAGAGDIVLSETVARALAERFAKEPAATVKAEIAKAFALTPSRPNEGTSVLIRALADDSDAVRTFGLRGLRASPPASALHQVVELLGSTSRSVRLAAAQVLQFYGPAIAVHAAEVRSRLAGEREAVVAEALQRALAAAGGR